MSESEASNRKKGSAVLFLLPAGAVVVLWVYAPEIVRYVHPEAGDSVEEIFSALSALFSGLAFAGVIWAIVLQARELELQRQELKETKEELRRSAQAQETYARLSALSALIQHYRDLSAEPLHEALPVRARLKSLVNDLESAYALVTGGQAAEALVLSPPPEPFDAPSSDMNRLTEVVGLTERFPLGWVNRLEWITDEMQRTARAQGYQRVDVDGRPVHYVVPDGDGFRLKVLHWKPGEAPKG